MADTQETHHGTWYLDDAGDHLHLVVPAAFHSAVERLTEGSAGLVLDLVLPPAPPEPPVLAATRGPETVTEPTGPTHVMLCNQLEIQVCRHGLEHPAVLAALKKTCQHPDHETESWRAERALAKGDEFRNRWNQLVARMASHGPDDAEAHAQVEGLKIDFAYKRRFIGEQFEKQQRYLRASRARYCQARDGYRCTVHDPGIEHRVARLAPSPRWTLVIDEGGSPPGRFGETVNGPSPRFVGLLVPHGVSLPPLRPGWHAADVKDLAELDRAMQIVLDHPVGVFGLSMASLTPSAADVWLTGVLEVIHGVLRQLPIDGPTRVEVQVEQRGEHQAGTRWQVLADEFMRQLAEHDPERHRHLEIDVQVIGKGDSPVLAHVDTIAHAWTSPTDASAARIRQSGLLGRCLLDLDASSLRLVWQALRSGTRPDAQAWARLVEREAHEGSMVADVLDDIRTLCREDATTWKQLLAWVVNRLEGREVQLATLGRAVAFLESCRPKGHDIPGTARLAWHIAVLEQRNHAGDVDQELARELMLLSTQLYEEHPALVCQADLVRAVLATNRFSFHESIRVLEPWFDREPAVAGLLRHGRVLSSVGQFHVFTGQPREAIRWFERALACFARLSDPARAALEMEQTRVYRAFAWLDLASLEPDLAAEARAVVQDLVNLMPARIDQLARDTSPRRMYLHHLLVRYLVELGDRFERQAYLAAQEFWGDRPGHPWPLIQLNRGLLLLRTHPVEARDQFRRGIDLALQPDQGPTVVFIGLVMAEVARKLGMPGLKAGPDRQALRVALPSAPWDALAELEQAPQDGFDPLVWLRRLLPFNFR